MNYGKILKTIRTYDLDTQEKVATVLGISKKTYGLYETQEKIIPLKYLNRICNLYNVSIDYVLGFSDKKNYQNSQNNINQKEIGSRLKNYRKEKHLSQREFSEKINIHPSTLSNYENGKNMITTFFLYEICKKFNVSADYLLGKIDS